MKVLYFLIVHKNPDVVRSVIEKLQSKDSIFLVHIDKDSECSFDCIEEMPDVHFTSFRYQTPWGSPELAFAVLDGLEEALRFDWDYVCLLSESDYPVKSHGYIAEYLQGSDKDHILINALPCKNPLETPGGHWQEGGRRRAECYAVRLDKRNIATVEPRKLDWGNCRQFVKVFRYSPRKLLEAIRILLLYPRRNIDIVPCGGHQWFILKRKTVGQVIDYVAGHPEFTVYCKNTQCLDEVLFPTLVNQVVKDKSTISKDILRYISWENNGWPSPRGLNEDDSDLISRCIHDKDILFVRKVGDERVCKMIDNLINKDQ